MESQTQKKVIMDTSEMIRVKIDRNLMEKAATVLAPMGLSPSDALRIMMNRVAKEQRFPFEIFSPNEKTIAAMKEARKGKLKSLDSVDKLILDLSADD
jgi:DNA-damage-inducible protein J